MKLWPPKPGFTDFSPDQLERAINVFTGFRVKGDIARPRLGKIRYDTVHRLDHKVDINLRGHTVLAQSIANQRSNGQVGNIVIVHDVEVDNIGPGLEDVIHFFSQAGEIR